jgi:hypothetical protein
MLVQAAAWAAQGHVAILSIDGLGAAEIAGKPSCIPEKGAIRSFIANGAYARSIPSVLPAITYPAHATIVTGVLPARHGVLDNAAGGEWFAKRSDIGVETLWDAAKKAGRSVAIVTWPSTYGAQVDWLVPEDLATSRIATEDIRKGSTPGLFDTLVRSTVRTGLMPFGHPDAGTPLDEMTARFAGEVVRRYKPELLLAHFLDYDHRMHVKPHSPEACRALERIDGWIAHIVDSYRNAGILDRTTFFIVSDHGFSAVKQWINVWELLAEAGLKDPQKTFDLKLAAGSAAFATKGARWFSPKKLHGARAAIARTHKESVRWITPAQAKAFGGYTGSLFALCARPGYALTVQGSGNAGAHGYCPDEKVMDAVFIASGHCVRSVGAIARMPMTDVGPTIARFLGARLADAEGGDRSARFRCAAS